MSQTTTSCRAVEQARNVSPGLIASFDGREVANTASAVKCILSSCPVGSITRTASKVAATFCALLKQATRQEVRDAASSIEKATGSRDLAALTSQMRRYGSFSVRKEPVK